MEKENCSVCFYTYKVDGTVFFDIILIEIEFQFLLIIMQSNTAFKFAPVISEEKKVDVSLQEDQTVIKLSTWTDDLGWSAQKTMSLDAEMLDELHRVITAARLRIKREKDDSGEEIIPSKVLEFPTLF